MTRFLPWILLILAGAQFLIVALPPGNADLISIQSLALDYSRGETDLLYPGRDFSRNEAWIAHHTKNLRSLGDAGEPNWCFYPPLIPYLLSPLAKAGAETWRIAWGMIGLGLVALYALLIRRLVMRVCACDASGTALVFALVLGSYPVARSVELGQTSLLMAVILWAGIAFLTSGFHWWRRLTVAVAAFVKPFLLLVEIPELSTRKYGRAAATLGIWAALSLIALILLGWSVHRSYADFLFTLGYTQTAYSGNQSLLAGILRVFTSWPVTDYGFGNNPGWFAVGRIVAVFVLVVAGWQSRSQDEVVPSVGLWLSAVLLALPISWEHHLLFLLPVIAWLWVTAREPVPRAALAVAAILMGVYWAPWYGDHGLGRLAACLPLIGSLLLFVLLIRNAIHGKKMSLVSASV